MVVDSDVNGFFNLNIAPAEGTPYDVPMYIERFFPADNGDNNHDDEDREIWGLPTTGASNIDGIYISHEEEQYYQITIGNRVPVLDGELHAHGDDRRIHLDWEDADELYPADYYTVYREEADDVDLGDSHYTDSEDRQGHDGQGLLYESDWGYFVTATNAAGESTNSTIFLDSSGYGDDEDGTGLEGGARTNDNLDPVARTNHIGADCTDFGDGAYEVNHDNDPGENPCTMEVYGGESGDDDEFDEINRYHWELEGEGAVTEGHENDFFAWLAVNAHDGDTKHFTATLTVESDYPVRDGIATRSNSTTISTSLADEPNEDPVASSALDLIDAGDGVSVSTSNDYDNSDWNDYDADAQLWYEPHDNNGDQNNADLHFDSFDSFDDDGDDLSYEWHLVTGALAGFSYDDLNGNDAYDFGEPFVLNGGDEIYDDLDLGDYVAGGPGAEHVGGDITQHLSLGADVYILTMTVTDVYGDSDASSLVVGVKPERNEGPSAGISDDQRWFMNYEQDQKEIDPVSGNASDPDSDDLHFAWSHSSNSNQGDLDLSGFDSSCGHGDDGCEPRVVHADLEEGTHTFTITATDSYGESASASNTVVILDEPNSPTATVTVTHTDLKWVEINVTEGTLDTGDLLNSDGSLGYTGDLQNTSYIDVFRNGDHLVTFGDDGDINEQFVDADLSASTEYIYTAISYNSDGYDTDADGDGTTTGDRPTVEVINPNGYEIFADGHAFDVHIATTDDQYIHKIEVDYNGNHYEYDGGHVFTIEGDATEVDYHSGVTVTVTDYGNYYGDNKESNQDSNDEDFITADQVISHDISDGWNLVGTQVELFDPVADLAMGSLGSFGDDWILYRSDGYFDEALLELNVGEGYFLYSYGGGNWVVEGEPVTGDPENGQLFSRTIGKGWNLVANPLVTYHDKNLLELEANGERKTWEEARFAGWVAESVLELFDGSSYLPTNVIRPSEGYWINTSLDELTIHFTSHAPSIDLAKENGEHLVRNYLEKTYDSQWNMILQATDGISSDEVIVALADEASDAVVYGEDEDKLMNRIFDGVFVSLDNNLYTDYRDEQYSDYESWTVKVAEHNSPLTFTADFSDIEADVHVVINGEAINLKENATFDTASEEMTIVVGDISKFMVPTQFALGSAYPNPFNPSTKLNLDITQTGHVSMEVYNIKGQVVETLLNGVMSAGYHTITWNANQLSSGMYFVKVIAGDNVATQKVMLLK